MTAPAGERATMREELSAIAGPILARIREHPFWAGLRDGTLPSASLWYFAEQDARHVVPTYARALARCGAVADHDAHGALLCSAASATFGSLSRLDSELTKLAEALGKPPGAAAVTPAPPIHAHTSFMLAAPAASFASGVGGLLPMTWFHLEVSDDLRERHEPGSRYAAWIDQYCPEGGFYREYVAAYLDLVDEVGGQCSAGERGRLVDHFLLGARYEFSFVDAAWQRKGWSV
ncbi:TenA family protein [Streptosporangium minutum]|nr:TenA family transcriptional regulator [Streptosporangium minutum]